MGYSDTIKNVMDNISSQENMYIEVTNTARIHVYKKNLIKSGMLLLVKLFKMMHTQKSQKHLLAVWKI